MIVRLKGVPPGSFFVQTCGNDFCKAKTIHGPIGRLSWAWAEEGVSVRPMAKCRKCMEEFKGVYELEPVEGAGER